MNKEQVIQQIDHLSAHAKFTLNDAVRYRQAGSCMADFCAGMVAGMNNAVAILATEIGIASPVWNKPRELAMAA